MRYVALVLLAGSTVAFGFLLYTLRNLDRLGIGRTHPRVLVEAGLGVALLVVGLVIWRLNL
jgi:hypothetical protein